MTHAVAFTDRDLEYARLICQDRIGQMARVGWSRYHVADEGRPGPDVLFELKVWVQRGEFMGSAIIRVGGDPHEAFGVAEAAMNRAAHFGARPR